MDALPGWPEGLNTNVAPWPETLDELLEGFSFMPGWRFEIRDLDRGQGSYGLTLVISIDTTNSYAKPVEHPRHRLHVQHYMPVPPAAYNRGSWQRWLFEQCVLVLRHEGMEFFETVCYGCEGDGWQRVLVPAIGDENRVVSTDDQCMTCGGRGRVKPFAPDHGDGADPYRIVERGQVHDRQSHGGVLG